MPQLYQHNTPRLFSTAGTFGEVDIIATDHGAIFTLTGRNYDTSGHLYRNTALANLSAADAHRLASLLREAVAVSEEVYSDSRQAALWSDATFLVVPPTRSRYD